MRQFKNKHFGETCVIVGNGPSLNDVPVRLLMSYPSFGTNRIYLKDYFTPDYYVCINDLVQKQFAADVLGRWHEKNVQFFLRDMKDELISPNIHRLKSLYYPHFSTDPNKGIYEGFTVTFVCMQLAYYMGFKKILLVGVDHYYKYRGLPNQESVATGEDTNHFHPGYFSDGKLWHNPDLTNSTKAYNIAKVFLDAHGVEVVNITTKTNLDVFPREDWKNYDKS